MKYGEVIGICLLFLLVPITKLVFPLRALDRNDSIILCNKRALEGGNIVVIHRYTT